MDAVNSIPPQHLRACFSRHVLGKFLTQAMQHQLNIGRRRLHVPQDVLDQDE
jgi:hypothetical protein